MTLIRSLFIKLGMLAAAAVVVLRIGWAVPDHEAEMAVDSEDAPQVVPRPGAQREGTLPAATSPSQSPAVVDRAEAPPSASAQLDLNRASADELQRLPGIGAVLAQRIVERRTRAGRFQRLEDLTDVKGIGAKRLERLRPLLLIGPSPKSSANSPIRTKDNL